MGTKGGCDGYNDHLFHCFIIGAYVFGEDGELRHIPDLGIQTCRYCGETLGRVEGETGAVKTIGLYWRYRLEFRGELT